MKVESSSTTFWNNVVYKLENNEVVIWFKKGNRGRAFAYSGEIFPSEWLIWLIENNLIGDFTLSRNDAQNKSFRFLFATDEALTAFVLRWL